LYRLVSAYFRQFGSKNDSGQDSLGLGAEAAGNG